MYCFPYPANNKLSNGGLKHLKNPIFDNLAVLSLTGCDLHEQDIQDLTSRPWNNLESIWISYNNFGLKGVELIVACQWPKLISLHLSTPYIDPGGNTLDDKGVETLLKYDWSGLKRFFLSSCSITDYGVERLCLCDWPFLETLKLNRNRITSKGIFELSKV